MRPGQSPWLRGSGTASSGHARSPPACRGLASRWRRTGEGGQPGAGRGATLSVIFRKSRTRRGFLARVRMVWATASPRALMRPIAKRRSRVMFSGPCPVRMRLRSSSKLQSRMWWVASNHPSDCSSSSRSFRLSKSASNILKQGNNSGTVRIAAKAPWRLYTVRTAGGNAETPIWPPDPPARRSRQAPGRRRLWGIRPRDRNVPVVRCQMRPLPPPDAAGGELYGMRQCPDRHASPCSCWAGSVPSKSGSSSVSSRT